MPSPFMRSARSKIHFPTSVASVLAFALGLGGVASAAEILSEFSVSADGWAIVGDSLGPVTWQATGGIPGGTIRVTDESVGGVMYWDAPAKFTGNQLAAYGRTLSFSIKHVIGGSSQPFSSEDVILGGVGLTLVYDWGANPPPGVWTTYTIPLTETGWRVGSLGGPPATTVQMKAVLGSLDSILIRAEFQNGADTDYLDNVVLTKNLLGDLNFDGVVNAPDLAILLGALPSASNTGDLNGDGMTLQTDLAILLGQWGATD